MDVGKKERRTKEERNERGACQGKTGSEDTTWREGLAMDLSRTCDLSRFWAMIARDIGLVEAETTRCADSGANLLLCASLGFRVKSLGSGLRV